MLVLSRKERESIVIGDVPVLRVLSSAGEVRAVIFGYACHPTTVGPPAWQLANPDYPGFARGTAVWFLSVTRGDATGAPSLVRLQAIDRAVGLRRVEDAAVRHDRVRAGVTREPRTFPQHLAGPRVRQVQSVDSGRQCGALRGQDDGAAGVGGAPELNASAGRAS